MKETIDTILERDIPHQSMAQRERLFARVMNEVAPSTEATAPVSSPYFSLQTFSKKSRVLVATMLIMVLSAGGTVAAAESAKPGDVLFPVEQATEQIRLTLATTEGRNALEAHFLEKRFREIDELVNEELLATTAAEEKLTTEAGELRIAGAIAVLLEYIERVDDPRQKERLRNVLTEVETIQVAGRTGERAEERRIRIDDSRFEVRTETKRIRVDDADGDMRIRYVDSDDDDNEYEVAPRSNSADTSDGSRQWNDDEREQSDDDEWAVVREQDNDEVTNRNFDADTDREEDGRNEDEDETHEDEKSDDSDDSRDDADQKEDDRDGHGDDDRDR